MKTSDNMIKINMKPALNNVDPLNFEVYVSASTTVSQLRRHVNVLLEHKGSFADRYVSFLLFQQKPLYDQKKVDSYELKDGDTVLYILRDKNKEILEPISAADRDEINRSTLAQLTRLATVPPSVLNSIHDMQIAVNMSSTQLTRAMREDVERTAGNQKRS
ncbi:MAG: hypothetical protein JSS50_00845 [Proteobacteria bacterium]|nr:hypothetical protein [Pseudomonadota bacterium]